MDARSMSPGTGLRRAWLAAGWLLVGAIVYLSLTPRPLEVPLAAGDKYGHLLAYGTAMLWFAQVYAGARRLAVTAALIGLGIALEYVQGWTGYRSFDVWDMAADAAGALAGLAAAPPRLPNALTACERWIAARRRGP